MKEIVFPERVIPMIQEVTALVLSTKLHKENLQGLVAMPIKYYKVSSLTD